MTVTRLLRPVLLAALLCVLLGTGPGASPARAAPGFSMGPSEELSKPLPKRRRRVAPRPARPSAATPDAAQPQGAPGAAAQP